MAIELELRFWQSLNGESFFLTVCSDLLKQCCRAKASFPKSSRSPRRSCRRFPASPYSGTAWTKRASSPRAAHATCLTRTSASRADSCRTWSLLWWISNGVSPWWFSPWRSCAAGCCSLCSGGWWPLRTEIWTLPVNLAWSSVSLMSSKCAQVVLAL